MTKARKAMSASFALSVVVLLALLARGWGESAWNVAAGVLLVTCLISCVVAAVTGERATRTVEREAERLAEARRQAVATD